MDPITALLTEAGRVLSGTNEAAVRQAISALQSVLAKLGGTDVAAKESAISEARRQLAEADFSYSDRERLLRDAIKAKLNLGLDGYVYLRDCYDDYAVYSVDGLMGDGGGIYKVSYAVDDAGTVTLGDPQKVQVVTSYVAVTEAGDPLADLVLAGDLVPLLEKAVRKDGTTSIKVISPGWGSSGYYSADVLKRDGPAAFPAGTHMYMDHPTAEEDAARPERSLKDLAATLTSAATWKDTGADGPGLYAEAKLRSDLAPLIEELAPSIGVSIRALGKAKQGEAEGRKGTIVEGIASGKSVDFVTLPGRGGKVLELVEAARARNLPQGEPLEEVDDMAELEEARTALAEARTALEAERAARQRSDERLLLIEADAFVADALAKVDGLPPITRAQLRRQLGGNPPLSEGKLDAAAYTERIGTAVQEELAYLAEVGGLGGGSTVRGMGGTTQGGATVDESKAKLTEALGRLDAARNGQYAEV